MSTAAVAWLAKFVPPSNPSLPDTTCTSNASLSASFNACRKASPMTGNRAASTRRCEKAHCNRSGLTSSALNAPVVSATSVESACGPPTVGRVVSTGYTASPAGTVT